MAASTDTDRSIIPSLPLDCIVEILGHIQDDSMATTLLYSYLQTSRQWAKLVVPMLWRCPFRHNVSSRKSSYIIRTMVSCLADEEKRQWVDHGFIIPTNQQKPLFNYPSYIRTLDTNSLQASVSQWLKIFHNIVVPHETDKLGVAINLIGQLIIGNSRGLESLRWDHDFKYKNKVEEFRITPILPNISSYAGIETALSSLTRFETQCWDGLDEISGDILTSDINSISRYSRNIQHIEIDVYLRLSDYKPLCQAFSKLIEVQASLRTIGLSEWWDHSQMTSVYTSIQSQAHSLKSFHTNNLRYVRKLLPVFSACVNLVNLSITNFYEIEDVTSLIENIASLPPIHVKHLTANYKVHFECYQQHFSSLVQLLIRLSNQKLRSLSLGYIDSKIIETINQSCPKISFLSSHLYTEDFPHLCKNLQGMTSLEQLILVIKSCTFDDMLQLASALPVNLRHLGIRISTAPIMIGTLLKNMVISIETLDIYDKVDVGLAKIIVEFAEKSGGLRKLGIKNRDTMYDENIFTEEIGERADKVIGLIGEPSGTILRDGTILHRR
ncbi:4256_t:CDS:1 [Acaulospora morrowiae]|uniref:4256_t:CDS:1 n=1 Tax=Acaulospora morrowiae TaxID=94023 RepID=A0A9N9ACU9_9GLOM|nr:4256_t:CDS:1 [Acaulospora morrowiae]